MNLCQIPGRAGALLTTLLRHISILNGFDNLMAQPLLSDEPLTALLDHYLDTDALADGLPLYVSLYPTEGACRILLTAFVLNWVPEPRKTPFFSISRACPRTAERGSACVSRAALLFRPREVQGTMFGDGGMGGWRNMQEIPCDASGRCRMQYGDCDASGDGSLWDRQAFPVTTILRSVPGKG